MFYHIKDLQFNARVSKPDPRFARMLLEQFGGPNGELKAAMQYFVQAFAARQPNFPPGVLQADPRYSTKYFNMSNGTSVRGPWNQGVSPELGETWEYIEDPIEHVLNTNGLLNEEISGTETTMETARKKTEEVSKMRTEQIKNSIPKGDNQWSKYDGTTTIKR